MGAVEITAASSCNLSSVTTQVLAFYDRFLPDEFVPKTTTIPLLLISKIFQQARKKEDLLSDAV